MYQSPETLFDKLNSLNYFYSDDHKLFKKMAMFDFESICVQEDKVRNTDTRTWIGKHVSKSVSISPNLIAQSIFLRISNHGVLVESFVDGLDGLATQSKAQLKLKFLEIETSVKSKLNQIFPLLINIAVAGNQYWNLKRCLSKRKKSKTCRHSFYKHKRINFLIFSSQDR